MDKIIDFDDEFDLLNLNLSKVNSSANDAIAEVSETSQEIENLYEILYGTPGFVRVISNEEDNAISELNCVLNDIVIPNFEDKSELLITDVLVSIFSGIIASIIDIVFVGSPEIVKIYKGGENFDGSIFTSLLRKIGNNDNELTLILHWLSDKCKVPYDLSAKKDVVYPDNHRIRNPGHDPLIGLMFAVVDIIMGTATLIDNTGTIKVFVRDNTFSVEDKFFSIIYYFGHLLSDICTARGLPIPGGFITQFFTHGEFGPNDDTIARIAEDMYRDGYDLRHLISMTTPVAIKDLIITLYLKLFTKKEFSIIETIADKEINQNKILAHKYKMLAISDSVACGGNILKFFLPPTSGNPTALNISEWISLIKNTIISLKYDFRDKSTEKIINNRTIINNNWDTIISNL